MARLLIIDDSPQVRRLLQVMLEARGHVLREAENGEVGWHVLQAETPDLILLDVMMPGPSGWQVLRQLRADARFALVPVIILTADGKVESEHQALADGADGFMVKPFSPMALGALIDQLLLRS